MPPRTAVNFSVDLCAPLGRRGFLKGTLSAAAGMAAPLILPGMARGNAAANERIALGVIGLGVRGAILLERALRSAELQVIALCDVDAGHLAGAIELASRAAAAPAGYGDFREMLASEALDAVILALPDHWHAVTAIACLEAGLDVYGEVPLAHSVREGRAICDAVKRHGRVWQSGSWQRSDPYFQRARRLVLSGRLGAIERVEVGTLGGITDYSGLGDKTFFEEVGGLDYDFWLGPAPWQPFHPGRVHQNWRWHLDYGGGQLMAWTGHHVDAALWSLGLDDSGPSKIKGSADFASSIIWNAPYRYDLEAEFDGGPRMRISSNLAPGVRWHGPEGWIYVDRQVLRASKPELLKREDLASDSRLETPPPDHWQDFLNAVRTREPTAAPCEAAHRAATVGQLGLVSLLSGREIAWDPEAESVIEDPHAAELLSRSYREPWMLLD